MIMYKFHALLVTKENSMAFYSFYTSCQLSTVALKVVLCDDEHVTTSMRL